MINCLDDFQCICPNIQDSLSALGTIIRSSESATSSTIRKAVDSEFRIPIFDIPIFYNFPHFQTIRPSLALCPILLPNVLCHNNFYRRFGSFTFFRNFPEFFVFSAAMAERIRLKPYIVITFLMTIVHSISAHWVWSEDGFLKKLGCVDAAGCSGPFFVWVLVFPGPNFYDFRVFRPP